MAGCAHHSMYTLHLLLVKLKIHGSVLLLRYVQIRIHTRRGIRAAHNTTESVVPPKKRSLPSVSRQRGAQYNNFSFSARLQSFSATDSTIFHFPRPTNSEDAPFDFPHFTPPSHLRVIKPCVILPRTTCTLTSFNSIMPYSHFQPLSCSYIFVLCTQREQVYVFIRLRCIRCTPKENAHSF